MLSGKKQKVLGSVYLPISVEESFQVIKALVVPSLKHDIILGVNFCKQFELDINFKNETWNIQSKLNGHNIYAFDSTNEPDPCINTNSTQNLSVGKSIK